MDKLRKAIMDGDLELVRNMITHSDMLLKMPNNQKQQTTCTLRLAVDAEINYSGKSAITRLIREYSSIEMQAEALVYFSGNDNYLPQAKALLEGGVSVDVLYKNRTALQFATSNRNEKMVHLLLSYGADPNAPGESRTAMDEARAIKDNPSFIGMMEAALCGEKKSPFDFTDKISIIKQLNKWHYYVESFLKRHYDKRIYVVALDGEELKANSEEAFNEKLKLFQSENPEKYKCEENIDRLRYNVENFTHLLKVERVPYIYRSIEASLDLSFLKPKKEENRTKSDLLLDGLLMNQDVLLNQMKRTENFKIITPANER